MALQFNPPDWVVQEYMNRRTPYQEAAIGMQTALQDYLAIDESKRRNMTLQRESDQREALVNMKAAEMGGEAGVPYDMNNPGPWIQARFAQHEAERREKDKNVSIEQYGALQSGDPNELRKVYPEGIPDDLAKSAIGAQSRNVRVTHDPYGNPVRVPVRGGPATPIEMPTGNYSDLQRSLSPSEYKDWMKEVNDFDSDNVIKTDRAALGMLNQLDAELGKYNKSLTGPLRSQQARTIAREVGALTDSDIARQSLDPSAIGRLKNWASIAMTGEIPEDQLDLLKQTVQTIKESSSSRIVSVARERAVRKSNLYGGKVSPDTLMQSLKLPTIFSNPSVGGGLDAKKKSRLEELRAKKAAGTLGR